MTNSDRKPWEIRMPWKDWKDFEGTPLWTPAAAKLSGSNGIYELADERQRVLYVGFAGSRARFGLRGKLIDHFSEREPNPEIRGRARFFRYEVTSAYLSRWVEVVARHNQSGAIPPGNRWAKEYPRSMPYFGPASVPAPSTVAPSVTERAGAESLGTR
ncbi:MAG TPA: hypothetical protein VNN10_03195 [Dehalococcoidia bacterium]|nr:hypothetical protein [Dehalococcoidia bacterium]